MRSQAFTFARFVGRVLREFRRNQGLLLSGAIAYYTLLSMLPLMALLLVVLSTLLPEDQLLTAVSAHLELILPTQTDAVLAQVQSFLAHRQVVGWFGFAVLLFFSSMAFTALENAMSVIFHRRSRVRRHFLISAIIPYLFILVLGGGLLLVTFISGALQAYESEELALLIRQSVSTSKRMTFCHGFSSRSWSTRSSHSSGLHCKTESLPPSALGFRTAAARRPRHTMVRFVVWRLRWLSSTQIADTAVSSAPI